MELKIYIPDSFQERLAQSNENWSDVARLAIYTKLTGVPTSDIPGDEERSLRLACLSEANATAKLGLAHNVYWTAERYLAWVKGETLVDPNSGLDLIQRLEALTQEFLREERSDPEKIKNDVAEWFSNFELRHPAPLRPDDAASAMTDAIFPPIPPIVHKDIQA